LGKISKALDRAGKEISESPAAGTSPPPVEKKPETFTRESLDKAQTHGQWDERVLHVLNDTPVFESFRRLRTKILHPDQGEPPRRILITSAVPGEGKSFVCANLAIALAQGMEQHALIVDADLRRPAQSKIFGVSNAKGLRNYLVDNIPLHTLLIKTGMPKLSLLPSGPPPRNPSELLGGAQMASLLRELSERYPDRFIIIDSPPEQAVSETAVLATLVDAIVLVVKWGTSKKSQVVQIVEQLGRDKIIGIVFNAYQLNELRQMYEKYYYAYTNKYYDKEK